MANVGGTNGFKRAVAGIVDGSEEECYIAQGSRFDDAVATAENGRWQQQQADADWQERQGEQSYFHAATDDSRLVDYALGSYLLVTRGKGLFGASDGYDKPVEPWTQAGQRTPRLGAPQGRQYQDGQLYRRQFENGTVTVNPYEGFACTADGACLAPTSASIRLG